MKDYRGCTQPGVRHVIEGVELYRCPLKSVTYIETERIHAYYQYKCGYLPNAGGYLDQPMKLAEVVALVECLTDKYAKEQQSGN